MGFKDPVGLLLLGKAFETCKNILTKNQNQILVLRVPKRPKKSKNQFLKGFKGVKKWVLKIRLVCNFLVKLLKLVRIY